MHLRRQGTTTGRITQRRVQYLHISRRPAGNLIDPEVYSRKYARRFAGNEYYNGDRGSPSAREAEEDSQDTSQSPVRMLDLQVSGNSRDACVELTRSQD